jgi:hypothetical protein
MFRIKKKVLKVARRKFHILRRRVPIKQLNTSIRFDTNKG